MTDPEIREAAQAWASTMPFTLEHASLARSSFEIGAQHAREKIADSFVWALLSRSYELYSKRFQRFIQKHGFGVEESAEMMQDAYLAGINYLRAHDPAEAFSPWLYARAKSAMNTRYKIKKRTQIMLNDFWIESSIK